MTTASPGAAALSVVVPVYGVEKWLDDCLNSIIDQRVDQEVIVVIDASPDRSVDIAREFERRYPEVRVVENAVNVGLGAARNIGLTHARGRFVTFPDSDDTVPPGTYAAMLDSLVSTGSQFATARADEYGEAGTRKRYWTTRHPVFERGARKTNLVQHPELVHDHTAWTKVFRRDFLDEHGIRWSEGTKCEDVLASTRAYVAADSIDVVPVTGYLYRRRPGSITTALGNTRTISDWARETGLAFDAVNRSEGSEAAQWFARKVLAVEASSRLDAIRDIEDSRTREFVLGTVARVLSATTDRTLDTVPLAPLRGLAELMGAHRSVPGAGDEHARLERYLPQTEYAASGSASRLEHMSAGAQDGTSAAAPRISVVMPTHDVAPWIDECIASVLAQDVDLELLVVDDLSTDGTWDRLLSWRARDPRVTVMRNPGIGGAQARNAALEHARGDYIAFCDGDDLVPRGAYAALLRAAEKDGAEVVVGGFQKFWATSTWRNFEAYGLDERITATNLGLSSRLIRNRTCWNRLVRRDFWVANKLHFPTTPRANDIVPMTAAMILSTKISVVPEVVYHYRARPGAGSMTAALRGSASTIGYFTQERICACIIGLGDDSRLAREYWQTALGVDGWDHLGHSLRASSDERSAAELVGISDSVRSLCDQAPDFVWEAIGPRKRVVYLLVGAGEFELARCVWGRETRKLVAPDRFESVLRSCEAIVTAVALGLERAVAIDVLRVDVLRPLIAACRNEVDRSQGPSAGLGDLVDGVAEFTRRLDLDISLAELPSPNTREERVVAALLRGGRDDVLREAQVGAFGPEARLTIEDAEGRTLRGRLELKPHLTPIRIEATRRGGLGGVVKRRAFTSWRQVDGGWSVAIDLAALEATRTWQLRVICSDALGHLRCPVDLDWQAQVVQNCQVRPQRGVADRLVTVARAVESVAAAPSGRLRALARRLRRATSGLAAHSG